MIKSGSLLLVSFALLTGCNSSINETPPEEPDQTIQYDSALAEQLGADKHGMRQYVIAYLIKGPNRDQDSTTAANIQRAHLDNIEKMANEGKLVLAGPFMDDGEIMGIYIFAVETIEEAKELTECDPAIRAGRLIMELHPWYGSAALMKVNELHKKVSKEDI